MLETRTLANVNVRPDPLRKKRRKRRKRSKRRKRDRQKERKRQREKEQEREKEKKNQKKQKEKKEKKRKREKRRRKKKEGRKEGKKEKKRKRTRKSKKRKGKNEKKKTKKNAVCRSCAWPCVGGSPKNSRKWTARPACTTTPGRRTRSAPRTGTLPSRKPKSGTARASSSGSRRRQHPQRNLFLGDAAAPAATTVPAMPSATELSYLRLLAAGLLRKPPPTASEARRCLLGHRRL